MAGAVGGVAGATDGRLAVVGGVAAEAALVDLALGRAVERQPHVLEVDDGVDRLLGEDLRGILVDEVVAALDGVEGVPLPGVLFDVRERRGHAALRRAGVRARRVELGDDRGPRAGPGLDRRPHPGAAGADDDDVELVVVDAVFDVAVGVLGGVRAHVKDALVSGCVQSRGLRRTAPGGQSTLSPVTPRHGSKVKTTRVPSRIRNAADEPQRPDQHAAGAGVADVVVDDRAHAVGAVDQREPQHQDVPPLPERAGELAGDEREVDAVDALAEHEVHEQVAEDQHDEHDARDAHVDPAPLLEVRAGAALRGQRAARVGDRGGGAHQWPPVICEKTLMRWRGVKPAIVTTQTARTPHQSWRW